MLFTNYGNKIQPYFFTVLHPQYGALDDKNKSSIKPIGFRAQKHIEDSNLPLYIVKIEIRCLLIVAAFIWLKYCRYGVKLYPINQSTKILP